MQPVLLPIYGPIAIHAYGLCIAVGGLITFGLLSNDKQARSVISKSVLTNLFQLIILAAYLGGRIVTMITEQSIMRDPLFLFKFWEPGFSILGSVIGVTVALASYFYNKQISLLLFLDRGAIYIPILQSFGRVGCFFAGCCYGMPSTSWYAVTYTDSAHMAPLHCSLHPAQLYSAATLFIIFLFLYFIQQYRVKNRGELFCSYIALIATERFLIDFVRWDRVFIVSPSFLQLFSVHQWIALAMCFGAMLGVLVIRKLQQ